METNKIELRECPFCGSHAVKINYPFYSCETACVVQCYNCFTSTGIFDSEDKAIKAWNRRVDNG